MNIRSTLSKAQHLIHNMVSNLGYGLANFRTRHRSEDFVKVRGFVKNHKMLMTPIEAYQLFTVARSVRKLEGDIAELGVAYGGSAKMISTLCPEKNLHLFDTFEGLPEPGAPDPLFRAGEFASSLPRVKKVLEGHNCFFYPGYFPDTAGPVADKRFCLVHLDADLYQSTADALAFFYERMVPGGVIIGHDYVLAGGVRDAFDGFFKDKVEPVVELSGNQCLVVKANGPN